MGLLLDWIEGSPTVRNGDRGCFSPLHLFFLEDILEVTLRSQDGLSRGGPILGKLVEAFVRQGMVCQALDDGGWNGGHISARQSGFFYMIGRADGGCEDFCLEIIIVIDLPNFSYSSSAGAEALKLSMPMTLSSSPTKVAQPNLAAASTAMRGQLPRTEVR